MTNTAQLAVIRNLRSELKKLDLALTQSERVFQATNSPGSLRIEVMTPMSVAFMNITESYTSLLNLNSSKNERNLVLSRVMLKMQANLTT